MELYANIRENCDVVGQNKDKNGTDCYFKKLL